MILLLYKVSFLRIPCQLSIGESSIGVPFRLIEIVIPLEAQMTLYSLDVYWKPWSRVSFSYELKVDCKLYVVLEIFDGPHPTKSNKTLILHLV